MTRRNLLPACTGETQPVIDGMFAEISAAVPSEWALAAKGVAVVQLKMDMQIEEMGGGNNDDKSEVYSKKNIQIKDMDWGKGVGQIVLLKPDAEALTNMRGTAELAKMAELASSQRVAGLIVVNPGEEIYQLTGTGKASSAIPVLMVKSSDAERLLKGSALIQDKGAPLTTGRGV